ncbi:MAG: hypothetical protein WDZ94_02125 [Patescibacteria group bacterium]
MNKLARVISITTGSHTWMPLLVVILTFQQWRLHNSFWQLGITLLIFLILIPFTYISRLIGQQRITDWDMRDRQQRLLASPLFLLSSSTALFVAQFLAHPQVLEQIYFLWLVTFASSVITQFWKISLHMVVNTAGIILINVIFSWQLPWLFLILLPVAWTRYSQKHHTLHQLLAGVSLVMAVALALI